MLKTAEVSAGRFSPGIFSDEQILQHWLLFAWATLKRLGLQHPLRAAVEQVLAEKGKKFTYVDGEDEMTFAMHLLDAIKERRPDIYRIFGDTLWPLQQWTYEALQVWDPSIDEATKAALLQAARAALPATAELEHFPDNPITVRQDPITGEHYLRDVEKAEPKHYMQIKAYFDSLQPARPVGRPRGGSKPKTSGRTPLDPELALRVYQTKLDTPKWSLQQAARALGERVPSDLKARERLRARVNRLLALGARLHRKKSVR